MKTVKSYNKQNKTTYVYEVLENHWDKEKNRHEVNADLLGKSILIQMRWFLLVPEKEERY